MPFEGEEAAFFSLALETQSDTLNSLPYITLAVHNTHKLIHDVNKVNMFTF